MLFVPSLSKQAALLLGAEICGIHREIKIEINSFFRQKIAFKNC